MGMHALILSVLILAQAGEPIGSTPEWKAYQEKLKQAYAIEVRWTETGGRTEGHGGPLRFQVKTLKPGYVFLELDGVYRRVWDGSKGIEVDLKAKTYDLLTGKPGFKGARWLGLPIVPWPDVDVSHSVSRSSALVKGERWPSLKWGFQGIDHGDRQELVFNPRTKLLAWWDFESFGMGGLGRIVDLITRFDLTPLPDRADFSLEPPAGFSKKPIDRAVKELAGED